MLGRVAIGTDLLMNNVDPRAFTQAVLQFVRTNQNIHSVVTLCIVQKHGGNLKASNRHQKSYFTVIVRILKGNFVTFCNGAYKISIIYPI